MKILKPIAIIIILLAIITTSQIYFDRAKARDIKPSPYVPDSAVVTAADLGLHSAASSLYWLLSIQYVGDWQTDKYSKLPSFVKLINNLDPQFSHPYAFATLIMPGLDQTDQAIEIAKRGIENADKNWEIPYYLGTLYHVNKSDATNTAKYFDLAAQTPGAPDNIKWIAANYGSRTDLREQTKQIWIATAKNSKDDEIRKRAETYVYHYELMDFLEQASTKYKEFNGLYPDPIEKLVDAKILKEIPRDPFGYKFYIDADGRARIKFEQ